jgi:hypothetical protein
MCGNFSCRFLTSYGRAMFPNLPGVLRYKSATEVAALQSANAHPTFPKTFSLLATPQTYFPIRLKGDFTIQFITATQTVLVINSIGKSPAANAISPYATSETSELSTPIEVKRLEPLQR